LIGGGWRDSTRVAAGGAEMWRDICLTNAQAITAGLDDLIAQLNTLRGHLEKSDGDALFEWFDKAGIERRKQGYFPRGTQ
jgi:prephenate dehydrogenase